MTQKIPKHLEPDEETDDTRAQTKKLSELKDQGTLSVEEFEIKKKELLEKPEE